MSSAERGGERATASGSDDKSLFFPPGFMRSGDERGGGKELDKGPAVAGRGDIPTGVVVELQHFTAGAPAQAPHDCPIRDLEQLHAGHQHETAPGPAGSTVLAPMRTECEEENFSSAHSLRIGALAGRRSRLGEQPEKDAREATNYIRTMYRRLPILASSSVVQFSSTK